MRVGTRGSRLALIQTGLVIDELRKGGLGFEFEPVVITTSGDRSASEIRGDGVFVKEIQRALAGGEIDIAVHSLKDLPTDPAPGLVIGAIPERGDPREALVGGTLEALPKGARVGTGSPRRSAQLRLLRNDLEVVPIRGNVPTRVEKTRRGEVDAVLLAAAGLNRLGIEADEILDTAQILPAPGQGALAVEVREDARGLQDLVAAIEDPATRAAVTAEREVLRRLGGGCMLPIGAYGRIEDGLLFVDAALVSHDGQVSIRAGHAGPIVRHLEIAAEVAKRMGQQGASALLEKEGVLGG